MTVTTVQDGQRVENFVVNNGDTLNIELGGTSFQDTIKNGGIENVAGTAIHSFIELGGTQHVLPGGEAIDIFDKDLHADLPTNVYGIQIIDNGGSTTGTVVQAGGVQNVFGVAKITLIFSGGTQNVEKGGFAIQSGIFAGGVQNVLDGGRAENDTRVLGIQNVQKGGVADQTIILKGGTQNVYGEADHTKQNDGVQNVYGTSNDATI